LKRLAIETSTAACSVALAVDGQRQVRREVGVRVHARVLVPWIRELLAEAEIPFGALDDVAVGRGPGGFTSLRLGLGVAQGIALAHQLPTRPVSSLAALAHAARAEQRRVLAVLDARMGEVYAGWFECRHSGAAAIGPEWLGAPDAIPRQWTPPYRAVGNGFEVHREALCRRLELDASDVDGEAEPTAAAVIELADAVEPVPAQALRPVYLRDRVTG
jgi:tRNA threonylcarbamoyladenosine biosynthesis protein TsaB